MKDKNIESVLEAILVNQNEGMDEMNKNLEAIIVQGEERNLEPILENMIIQNDESQKILTDINNSIKELVALIKPLLKKMIVEELKKM
jgi:hypothetical protein